MVVSVQNRREAKSNWGEKDNDQQYGQQER